MEVKIKKPPIPILFLDTFFFIDFVGNKHRHIKSAYFNYELKLIELIYSLTKQKKLFCPHGDQDEEYGLGIKNTDEIRQLQTQLSYGIRLLYHWGVKRHQTKLAMTAYIKGENSVTYDYRSIFISDPINEIEEALSRQWLVSVHLPIKQNILDKERKTKKELALEFEKLRQEKINAGIKFDQAVKAERLGTLNAIRHIITTIFQKVKLNRAPTEEDVEGMMTLGEYLTPYSRFAKRDVTIPELLCFLTSEYFTTIPYIDIQSKLYASLLTQKHPVKGTDNFDFHQTSQVLPFSSYFLTDNSLKHRLTIKPLNLDKKYGVKIYCIKEIGNLIDELSKL